MSASMDTVPIQHTDGQKLRESVTKYFEFLKDYFFLNKKFDLNF